ncbi:hypothetical protein KVR01_012842 [Diaporthe batatas]|uniref:uncharacterized protein n=1 Tax=Diaporthe batatas TaxID=748121 RepID=UPI001D04E155|nr:uncharacterized protein KVR01_012842 [Diaporthe batatas]KAG8157458.1 hypothetical protein KVR01_012842 [Diaporthe batatas]
MADDSADQGSEDSYSQEYTPRPGPCAIPAAELQHTPICQLKLNSHNPGKRTAVHVTRPATRCNDVLTASVDDERWDRARVCLEAFCQPSEEVVPAEQVLRRDSWYLIKEPWALSGSDGIPKILVGHPGDISWLPDDHELMPDALRNMDWKASLPKSGELRSKGNEAVGKGAWAEAEHLYSNAILVAQTAEETSLAYLNRSLANLRLGRTAAALADGIKSNETATSGPTERGLFREAAALYYLAKFEQCLDKLQELTTSFYAKDSATSMIDRVRKRLDEQQTGQYDFKHMYRQAKLTPPLIDCATYTMPVEIKESPGKGRGVFTKRKVLAGELLVCEKAFCYVCRDRDGREPLTDEDADKELFTQVVQKIFHNIEDARMFADLYNGDNDSVVPTDKVDGKPVIDSSIVRTVLDLTKFVTPRTSRSGLVEYISGGPGGVGLDSSAVGLWSFTSHVNHSCIYNACPCYIGDMQILRATQDLEEGTEILISYESPEAFEGYDDTQERLSIWGFECNCALCRDRQETPKTVDINRDLIRQQILLLHATPAGLLNHARARRLLDELDQTYSPAARQPGAVRLEVAPFRMSQGNVFAASKKLRAMVDMYLEALEAYGFVISARPLRVVQWGLVRIDCFQAFRNLSIAYKLVAPENVGAARGYMRLAYTMVVGEGESMDQIVKDKPK